MIEPVAYTYAILRYFHDIATGECVNVGVAVFAPKVQFLQIRCSSTAERVARVFPDLDRRAFETALRAIELGFASLGAQIKTASLQAYESSTIAELARTVLPTDDSSLKWASLGSGLTADPKEEINKLFQRMVQRYEQAATGTGVLAATSEGYTRASKVPENQMEYLLPAMENSYSGNSSVTFPAIPNLSAIGLISGGEYAVAMSSNMEGLMRAAIFPLTNAAGVPWMSTIPSVTVDPLQPTTPIPLATERKIKQI